MTCGSELVKLIGTLVTVPISGLVTASLTCVSGLEPALGPMEPETNATGITSDVFQA